MKHKFNSFLFIETCSYFKIIAFCLRTIFKFQENTAQKEKYKSKPYEWKE